VYECDARDGRALDTPPGCSWVRVRFQAMVNPLIEAGFVLDRVVEPLPRKDFEQADA
jgi:hypothetical protein